MGLFKKVKVVTAVAFSAAVLACTSPQQGTGPDVAETIEVYQTIDDLIEEGEDYFGNRRFIGTTKMNGYEFDLSKSNIIWEKDCNSKKMVILIKDMHNSPNMQEEIFLTLEELVNECDLKIVGLEGWYENEVTKDGFKKELLDRADKGLLPKDKVEKFLRYCDLLSEYCSKPENSKRKSELIERLSYNLLGGYLFEMVYDMKVKSIGLEDEQLYNSSKELYTKLLGERRKSYLDDFAKKLIAQRSRVAVDKILGSMEKENLDLGCIILGAGHTKSATEYLEERKISYIVLEPASYEPRSNQFNFEKWLKKKTSKIFRDNKPYKNKNF